MQDIYKLAVRFRKAVESAHDKGLFAHDTGLDDFPTGSCGDICYLLAEYLRGFGIETIWYSAERDDRSHAWLVVKDTKVKRPTTRFFEAPDDIRGVLNLYSGGRYNELIDITRYEGTDLQGGLIIDITGDQFNDCDCSVYVGGLDPFHRTFEFIQAYDYDGLNGRQFSLYRTIIDEM